jgi:hypothetical protein
MGFSLYTTNCFTDIVGISFKRLPLQLLGNSAFRPYWSIIKHNLHNAINGLQHVSHKPFYRYCWNLGYGRHPQKVVCASSFQLYWSVILPILHKAINGFSTYSINYFTDYVKIWYERLPPKVVRQFIFSHIGP